MNERELHKLSRLAEIASLYYERGFSQSEISEKLCISRSRISRLLQEAIDRGVVEINVHYSLERHYELELQLKERLRLRQARVLNNRGKTAEGIQSGVSSLAADYLQLFIRPDRIIGLSWGKLLSGAIELMEFPSPVLCRFVQLDGSEPLCGLPCADESPAAQLASRSGGTAHLLEVPPFLPDAVARAACFSEEGNAVVRNMQRYCDLAVMCLEPIELFPGEQNRSPYLSETCLCEAIGLKALGTYGGRFLGREGQELDCAWNRAFTGAALRDIRQAEEIVCLASGRRQVPLLRAALSAGLVDTLITDGTTAARLLRPNDTTAGPD